MSSAGDVFESSLSGAILEKAVTELKEKPQWRDRDIQALRDMVKSHKGLKCPLDSGFLLRFLRAKKFDYDRAYQLLVQYYTIRVENAEVLKTLTPQAVSHAIDHGVSMCLPNRDQHGRRILYFRPGKWQPEEYPIYDILRLNILNLEMMVKDEETQVTGIVAIGNMADMGWNHAKNFERNYARIMSSLLQDAFPMRFKGLHLVNEPNIFSYVFAIIKPFLKEKIASRMKFHGSDVAGLQKEIGLENLPQELGGSLPPSDKIAEEWKEKLFASSSVFEEMAKYTIELPRNIPGLNPGGNTAGECLGGTYRKLNVD